ncbi:MAG: hypothetical protein AB1650_00320 [Candidatus Omnitrophota bacterium]
MIKILIVTVSLFSLLNLYVFPDINDNREWFECDDRTIPAEKTRFDYYGVEIYRSLSDDFLFIVDEDDGKSACIPIGEDQGAQRWILAGFKKIKAGKFTSRKVIAFEIQRSCVSRYFNIKNGKEIFVDETGDGQLYVDYEQEIEEEPFKYPYD